MLIVGGTGMLKEASEYFIKRENQVTLVARNSQKLETFKSKFPDKKVNTLAIDYTNTESFIQQIKAHFQDSPICKKVVCWIHGSGNNALNKLINLMNSYSTSKTPIQFYHILGSASRNPTRNQWETNQLTHIQYHTIILGFKRQDNYSRWLTHNEISEGVIQAVESEHKQYIIGQIEPWDLRP